MSRLRDPLANLKSHHCRFCEKRFETEEARVAHTNSKHAAEDNALAASPPSTRKATPDWIVPRCVECGKVAEAVTGERIYPHRPDLFEKSFYLCECGSYCGCHHGTAKPLGYPCGPETRRARQSARRAFDPVWQIATKQRKQARGRAYAWLAHAMGLSVENCHIGMMTKDQARIVVELVKALGGRGLPS